MISKRLKRIIEITKKTEISLEEAIKILKECPKLKFDESVDISMRLNIDAKKSQQQVRGTVMLPHGSGKKIKVIVFAKEEKAEEAKKAGADFVGTTELMDKIKEGWLDFDFVVATPEMMRELGKLAKILGPRGLMPSPKSGTVTMEIEKVVNELKKGKVEFKTDKTGCINNLVGKLSFEEEPLKENLKAFIHGVTKNISGGIFGIKSLYVSSTMGPGLKIDIKKVG